MNQQMIYITNKWRWKLYRLWLKQRDYTIYTVYTYKCKVKIELM